MRSLRGSSLKYGM